MHSGLHFTLPSFFPPFFLPLPFKAATFHLNKLLNMQVCHSDIYLPAEVSAPDLRIGFELTSVSVLESSGQIPCCVQILAGTPQEDVTVLIVDQSGTAASKLNQLYGLLNIAVFVHDSNS